jgi:hypothetical protein
MLLMIQLTSRQKICYASLLQRCTLTWPEPSTFMYILSEECNYCDDSFSTEMLA